MKPLRWRALILLAAVASACGSPTAPTPASAPDVPPAVPTATPALTLRGKSMMGYQGWFACPGDGSALNRWQHWFRTSTLASVDNLNVDMWPDTSELDADERCATPLVQPDGRTASLFSAYNAKTVARHFRWMREYGIDGVFVQRFTVNLSDGLASAFRNQVLQNARAGAEASQRVFAVMYDISGQNEASLVDDLRRDWTFLVDALRVTESPYYLREGGKPVLAIWGLGFNDRPGSPAQAKSLIEFLKSTAASRYRVTLMGGVPARWRSLGGDSRSDPDWAGVYRSFDVLSPWAVGRFNSDAGADAFARDFVVPDLAEARAKGILYAPVIFPGFSWYNKNKGPFNQIPRRGGRFYWRQAWNAVSAGCDILYGAMFDEVDEGTAMFKLAPTGGDLPAGAQMVALDADGEALPSDWYLRVARETGRLLRGEIPLSPQFPLAASVEGPPVTRQLAPPDERRVFHAGP